MSETTDNPHDRYFKEAFSQIDILNDFLNIYLPDALRQAIDFSSVRRDTDTFTDESLSEHFADLIFTATLDGQPAHIALLLEHKSYTEPHIHFQLNRYMLNVWEQQLTHRCGFIECSCARPASRRQAARRSNQFFLLVRRVPCDRLNIQVS